MPKKQSTVEYREIKGFPGYRVGDDGSVWSRRPRNGRGPLMTKWVKLSPTKDKNGWLVVTLLGKQQYVHRLVLLAFRGPCPKGQMCRHFPDPNPLNNHLCNLQWGTRKDNALDAISHGAQIRGEQCHRSKLNEKQVRMIREKHSKTNCSFASLSREYGIAATNIKMLIDRKTWKHVIDPSSEPFLA